MPFSPQCISTSGSPFLSSQPRLQDWSPELLPSLLFDSLIPNPSCPLTTKPSSLHLYYILLLCSWTQRGKVHNREDRTAWPYHGLYLKRVLSSADQSALLTCWPASLPLSDDSRWQPCLLVNLTTSVPILHFGICCSSSLGSVSGSPSLIHRLLSLHFLQK